MRFLINLLKGKKNNDTQRAEMPDVVQTQSQTNIPSLLDNDNQDDVTTVNIQHVGGMNFENNGNDDGETYYNKTLIFNLTQKEDVSVRLKNISLSHFKDIQIQTVDELSR